VPSYVRNEIKSKTGIVINEYGKKVNPDNNEDEDNDTKYITNGNNDMYANVNMYKNNGNNVKAKEEKKYTPINSYKPSGKLIYNDELFNDLEDKIKIH
jgi:hypothetical protein